MGKSKAVKVFQILTLILYIIATIFQLILLIDIISRPQDLGTAIAVALWIIFGAIGFSIVLVFALIGFIVSLVKRSKGFSVKGAIIYFIVFSVLPILTYFIGILTFNLIL